MTAGSQYFRVPGSFLSYVKFYILCEHLCAHKTGSVSFRLSRRTVVDEYGEGPPEVSRGAGIGILRRGERERFSFRPLIVANHEIMSHIYSPGTVFIYLFIYPQRAFIQTNHSTRPPFHLPFYQPNPSCQVLRVP